MLLICNPFRCSSMVFAWLSKINRLRLHFVPPTPPPRFHDGICAFALFGFSRLASPVCALQLIGDVLYMLLPIGCCFCLIFLCVWGCSHRFPLSFDYARIFSTRREDALECRASISCAARALLAFAHSGVCPLMSECTRLHACSDFAAFFCRQR
jgi:hypothetical protein